MIQIDKETLKQIENLNFSLSELISYAKYHENREIFMVVEAMDRLLESQGVEI